MELFTWNNEKNHWLKETRGISFSEILQDIERGQLLDTIEHPNQAKYPGQRIFIIDHDGYCVLVPFIKTNDGYYLKTLFPSRKATKEYMGGNE